MAQKWYIIYNNTLRELQKAAQKEHDAYTYSNVILYEHKVDRSDMSEAQKILQAKNRWYAEHSSTIYIDEYDTLYNNIKSIAYDEIFGGCKEGLEDKIFNKIMDTKLKVIASTYNEIDKAKRVSINQEFGDEKHEDREYSNALEEFEEELKSVKRINSFASNEYVYLEKLEVKVSSYRYYDMDTKVKKLIKKFIKDELTYCIKNDKIIVPDEYITKGIDGIKEWRELKRSGNKNNSMEKRMLRQIVADKKTYAFNGMNQIVDAIARNSRWDIPTLEIDGRFNKQKIKKLVTMVLDEKNKQYYIDASDEEIIKKFKEYWKGILMDAYDRIDKLEVKAK